jgi:hypothetical protein
MGVVREAHLLIDLLHFPMVLLSNVFSPWISCMLAWCFVSFVSAFNSETSVFVINISFIKTWRGFKPWPRFTGRSAVTPRRVPQVHACHRYGPEFFYVSLCVLSLPTSPISRSRSHSSLVRHFRRSPGATAPLPILHLLDLATVAACPGSKVPGANGGEATTSMSWLSTCSSTLPNPFPFHLRLSKPGRSHCWS